MEEKIDKQGYEKILEESLSVSEEDIFNCCTKVDFEKYLKLQDSDERPKVRRTLPNLDKQEKAKFPCPTHYEEKELQEFLL